MTLRFALLVAGCLSLLPSALANFALDIQDREQVRAFFNSVYAASTNAVMNGTAAIAGCDQGTIAADFKEKTRLRVNFYRAMAGVPSGIVFDEELNAKCQRAALMMSANNSVSHTPPASWSCYTADGRAAAEKSNLALGFGLNGPGAVDGYMLDRSPNNFSVGHRRWVLFPQTQTMGAGDVDFGAGGNPANALWVVDGNSNAPRPATRNGFVAWPPAGFMPSPIMPVRWSISFPGADFSAASVTLSSNGVPVAVTKENLANPGAGENTLVWFINGMTTAVPFTWPRPAADVTFDVTVSGVSGLGVPPQFVYTVKLFDPEMPTEGAIVPTVSGPSAISAAQPTQFGFTTPAFATGNDLRVTPLAPHAQTDGAENLLVNFVNVTSPSTLYSNIVSTPVASGTKAFRLNHTGGIIQHLTYRPTLLPRSGAELRFASKLGKAAVTEHAKVQVSTNNGIAWVDVYSQSGSGSATVPTEASYVNRTVSLAQYANQIIKVRFSFAATGATFGNAGPDFGWYFDDISFANTSELLQSTIETLPMGPTFTFTAPAPGEFLLQTRPEVWDDFQLDFGPGKVVLALGTPTGIVTLAAPLALTASDFRIEFDITGADNPVAKVFKASAPSGPWTLDETATIEVVPGNDWFRAIIPRPAANTFYRPGY